MTKRPDSLSGTTHRVKTPCGTAIITLNTDDNGNLIEILFRGGKGLQCRKILADRISKAYSMLLQAGTPLEEILRDIEGQECDAWTGSPEHPKSCYDALARAIRIATERTPAK
jgi:hypothetical protein